MVGARQRTHTDKIHLAIQSNEMARSALVASWRRSSSLHGLDPADRRPPERVSEHELHLARQRIESLIRAARTSIERLYLAVGGVGCCVLLADRDGVPLERRGAPGDDRTFYDWGLWTGSVWSEEKEGTNGIGTCLVEKRAVTIHRDEHFHSRNTLLSCVSAPLYDHEGNLVAVLDVSSCRADLTKDFLNLIAVAVSDAARSIEAENFRLAFPDARVLYVPNAQNALCSLIALDHDDLVVGASRSARLAFGLTAESFRKAIPASQLLPAAQMRRDDFSDAERSVVQRALARAGGKVAVAARELGISRATLHRKLARLGVRRIAEREAL